MGTTHCIYSGRGKGRQRKENEEKREGERTKKVPYHDVSL